MNKYEKPKARPPAVKKMARGGLVNIRNAIPDIPDIFADDFDFDTAYPSPQTQTPTPPAKRKAAPPRS